MFQSDMQLQLFTADIVADLALTFLADSSPLAGSGNYVVGEARQP